jgi:hypothetical protein
MLSWFAPYRPGLGEQPATVIRTIDAPRLEALMVRLMANGQAKMTVASPTARR